MAEIRIDRSVFTGSVEFEEAQDLLGLGEESTSLPEWQGWDRLENASLPDSFQITGLDVSTGIGPALEQLRNDSEYAGMPDLDDKRLLLDALSNISAKLEDIAGRSSSEKLLNFQESLNETLELYQSIYGHQIASIKA